MVFSFLKNGRKPAARSDSPPTSGSTGGYSTLSHTATHRELVRVVLRDTLRMHGIPIDWIGCELSPHPKRKDSLLIQLVLHHWHADLPSYALVLQRQFMEGLQRFDPASDHGGHLVLWRFAADCGCPHTTMPAPGFWEGPAPRPRFDLPDTGRDLRKPEDDFVPTVPSALV